MTYRLSPTLRAALLATALSAASTLAACGQESPQKLLEKARASIAARDFKAAEIHVKNALQQKPDDAEARLTLAEIHLAGRDLRSAEKELTRALELGLSPDRALPRLLEARVLMGDGKGALAAATTWQATQPRTRAESLYWSGRAHALLGQTAEATKAFNEALGQDGTFQPARVSLIAQQAARGDLPGAAAAIDAVLAQAPALPDALLLKAEIQIARGAAAEARETLGKAIEADPTGTAGRLRLIGLLIDAQELDAAEAQLAQLQKIAPSQLQVVLAKATIDFRRQRLEAARDGVTNVLKVAPDFVPASALASLVHLGLGSLEQAETHARQWTSRAPDSVAGQRTLAAILLRRNDPDKALQISRAAIDRGARDPVLYQVAGEAALRRNELPLATGYFEQAARIDPRSAASRTGLGLTQIAAGRSDVGFGTLESASELDPQSVQADLALITARINARQYDQALAAIDRLEKKQPGSALPHQLRGSALMAKGDPVQARASFERAAQIDPSSFPAVGSLAQLDIRERKGSEARKRLEAFVQAQPKAVQGWLALAEVVAITGGQRDELVKLLTQAQTANPDAIEPALALARVHLQANQPREAIPILQRSLVQHPDDRQVLDALGTAFLRAEEKQQALEAFERIVRLEPKSVPIHVRMGELKAALGDTAGAMASFRTAAELDPKAPQPQFGIAAMLLKQGRKDDARRIAASLQQSQPGSPAGLELEGDLLAADGKWPDAAGSYRKAMQVQRTTPLVLKLHQALARADRTADADAALREAVRATPNDPALRLYAGERAVSSRQWPAAIEHYQAVLAVAPDNVVALNNLAWSMKEAGDPRALQVAEDALARAPRAAAVLDTVGVILSERGQHARALELLAQATELAPKAPALRLHRAQALARAGDKPAAKAAAEELARDFPDTEQAKAARELAASL